MPKELELKLEKEARKKFCSIKSKRAKSYIFGTLRKTGWIPSTQLNKRSKKNA